MFTIAVLNLGKKKITQTSSNRKITNEDYTVLDLSFHLSFFFSLLLIYFVSVTYLTEYMHTMKNNYLKI